MARYGAAILTIAGTIVGAYFGYPALGAALGSLAGALIFTAKGTTSTGPRLADITQTTSSVGVNIPRGWGTFAVAGTFIAQSSLREVMVSQTQGGKGQPSGSTTTTPTYYQDFAILINDSGPPESARPLVGVRTVWANGKAIYDRRPRGVGGNSGETDAQYQQRLAASDQLEGQFTLYLGTEDQLPDPTLEATYGVGQISAFRGCAYVVFINWQNKAEDGNRIPATWLFECYTDGESADESTIEYAQEALYPWLDNDPPLNPVAADQGSYTYQAYWAFGSEGHQGGGIRTTLDAALLDVPPNFNVGGANAYVDYNVHNVLTSFTGDGTSKTGGTTVTTPGFTDSMTVLLHYNDVGPGGGFFPDGTDLNVLLEDSTHPGPWRVNNGPGWDQWLLGGIVYGDAGIAASGHIPYDVYNKQGWDVLVGQGGAPLHDYYYSLDVDILVTRSVVPPPDPCDAGPSAPVPLANGTAPTVTQLMGAAPVSGLDGYVVVNGELRKCGPWTLTAGTWHVLQSVVYDATNLPDIFVRKYPLGPALPLGHPLYDDEAFWTAAYDQAVAAHQIPAVPALFFNVDYPVVQDHAYQRTITQTTATTFPAVVADVVSDLCAEAGYAPSDIDVSELGEMTITGYVRTGIMAARDAIDPLRQVCFFDGVESNGVLKFVARGQANSFAFGLDDLGATLEGDTGGGDAGNVSNSSGNNPATRISTVKQLETDLPRRVTVSYMSQARDYQINNQASPVRVNTRAVNETQIQLPMVLDDSQALTIATALWAQAWVERWTHTVMVDGGWQELEPADCGTIPLDGLNVRVRITDIQDALPATRQLSLTRDEAVNYNPTRVAGAVNYTPVPIAISTPVIAFMLDLPALQDQDNDPGIYFACASQLSGNFKGAQLYRSADNGGSYQLVGAVSNESTYGTVVTPALPTASFDIVDGVSVLVLTIGNGSFDSCTFDAMLADSNALAVGADGRWEIIQFMTAAQISSTVWQLSGLLRGRRGTEQYIGTGQPGDLAVLVSGVGIGRASLEITGVGKSYPYRVLGNGQALDQVSDFYFTGNGVALKPFSPAAVEGVQDRATGNWTISWLRRGRIGQTLQSGVDIALSEDDQDFEVDILDGAKVLRTISSSLESLVYNAAAQITDFGSAQTTLEVAVYQVSAQVGRGYPTIETLTVPAYTPPGDLTSTLLVTFGGSAATTDQWAVDVGYAPRAGGAGPQHFTFNLSGGSPNGVSDYAANLASQATTDLAGLATVTHALGVVTIVSTTGILTGGAARNTPQARGWCGLVGFDGPGGANQYSVQAAAAAVGSTEGFYGVDLYAPIGGGIAPASDPSYNVAGTYVKRFKIYNLDADLNAQFVAANSPPGSIVPGDYCFKTDVDISVDWSLGVHTGGNRSLIQVFSGDGVGGIVPELMAHPVLSPLIDSASVTGNRPCVEITLKDGWALIDDGSQIAFGDPEPCGFSALTSTVTTPVKGYAAGRAQIDTVEFEFVQSPLFGAVLTPPADIAVGQTLRVTVNGTNYDHAIDSTDLLDVTGVPAAPHYLDRSYGAIADLIRATGDYEVTLIERDGQRTGSPSLNVTGMSVRAKVGGTAYAFTADVLPGSDMTITISSTS